MALQYPRAWRTSGTCVFRWRLLLSSKQAFLWVLKIVKFTATMSLKPGLRDTYLFWCLNYLSKPVVWITLHILTNGTFVNPTWILLNESSKLSNIIGFWVDFFCPPVTRHLIINQNKQWIMRHCRVGARSKMLGSSVNIHNGGGICWAGWEGIDDHWLHPKPLMVLVGLSAQLMNSDGQFVKSIDRQQDVLMVSMANEKHSH